LALCDADTDAGVKPDTLTPTEDAVNRSPKTSRISTEASLHRVPKKVVLNFFTIIVYRF